MPMISIQKRKSGDKGIICAATKEIITERKETDGQLVEETNTNIP